jgi:hypothetical protein
MLENESEYTVLLLWTLVHLLDQKDDFGED